MRKSALWWCVVACALAVPLTAQAANDGDIDEYAVRQKIRKLHPNYSLDKETQVFLLHKLSPALFKYDHDFDGDISPSELKEAVDSAKSDYAYIGQLHDYRRGAQPLPQPPDQTSPRKQRDVGAPEDETVFILRRKFDQISSLAFPGFADEDASGAQFSYGQDNVAHNTTWAAQGVAMLLFGRSYPTLD